MRKLIILDRTAAPAAEDNAAVDTVPRIKVDETPGKIELSYAFPAFYQIERKRSLHGSAFAFSALEISGAGSIMESGKPQLPSFGRYVQIPDGCDYRVKVSTPGTPVQLDGVLVSPAQAKLSDAPGATELEYDEAFYQGDAAFPQELVATIGPLALDGYRALLLHVCPFQYYPKSRRLVAYPHIDVSIELEQRDVDGGRGGPERTSAQSREAFGNLFLNPGRSVATRLGVDAPSERPSAVGPELLIVHAASMRAAAERLAHWKNQRGLITATLAYKPDPQATDQFSALKQLIRAKRSAPGARLRYVLLLGDADDIPTGEQSGVTGDYYLSTAADYVSGGELPMPWLALGRIPVRDDKEALAVVKQIIDYEQRPPVDPNYYRRFVCVAHFETHLAPQDRIVDQRDYVYTMETIRAHLASLGLSTERIYTSDRIPVPPQKLYYMDETPVPADLVAQLMPADQATRRLVEVLNQGCVIIGHRDHGNVDGWFMPPLQLPHLDGVTSTVPSIMYSLNCLTGAFDETTTTECFAEKILRIAGGAPTLVAATELSSTFYNNAMMRGLYDAMFGGLIPTFPTSTVSYPLRFNRFGEILSYARAFLATEFRTDPAGVLANFLMYHVLGDPSLEVWAAEPKPLHLKARPVAKQGDRPHGVVIDLSEVVKDCIVTVWFRGEQLLRLIPTGSRFTIAYPQAKPGPIGERMSICAWAPGRRFASLEVPLPRREQPQTQHA